MIAWRFARVIVHLFAGLLTCALVFPWTAAGVHERLIRRWSRKLLQIVKVDARFRDLADGAVAERSLIVANHVSWLDIFVMNSVHPCHFVAKSDIRGWPLIGWLCEKTGTIFIARGKQREVRKIYEGLVHQIQAGQRVAFFPEGTTAPQGSLLPFHANLFEAAIQAQVPIQPFAVRYVDGAGALHPAADFIGDMTFVQSMAAILKAGGLHAELVRLPQIGTDGAHRRDVAQTAREAVALGLGMPETQV
ncbi:1-acyl-sn-glycerol-3-phosphate acyltransferase [Undibacterium sp.]|jgi:1-acyl-sn-glycerol-3-phosphate acyltransferase|uniref:lysophospholipid acyltransferase family protein n=1 Tax=Undibacterium sp. TaxID=1914977 RepID=UPI002BF3A900|nr:1-acyl-sn-glycerol-3-phosphate acyltransferase [Undibacterium sp.]HTD03573.1 1-acyl-sn-glycerol-3-phosphate acyltransferase [Undibacterium sp.]